MRERDLSAQRYRCASQPDGVVARASIVETIVSRDKNRRSDKASKGMNKGERERKKMPDDDDDNDNTGEDGKIISLAKESTMPARYCIHTVLIRAMGVKL